MPVASLRFATATTPHRPTSDWDMRGALACIAVPYNVQHVSQTRMGPSQCVLVLLFRLSCAHDGR
jgi:hypothetical protein